MRERSKRQGRAYSAIPNSMLRDASLSIEARGLLSLLMSYSDDWEFHRDHLLKITGMGKDRFGKIMGELIQAGHVEMTYLRDEKGHLLGKTWVIRDDKADVREMPTSVDTDVRENRRPENPTSGESAPIRRTTDQEDQKVRTPVPPEGDLFGSPKTDEEVKERSAEIRDAFESFWRIYPKSKRKTDRPKAFEIYRRIVRGQHRTIPKTDLWVIHAGLARFAASGPDPDYVPLPTTWLNGARWEADYGSAPAEARRRPFAAPDWERVER